MCKWTLREITSAQRCYNSTKPQSFLFASAFWNRISPCNCTALNPCTLPLPPASQVLGLQTPVTIETLTQRSLLWCREVCDLDGKLRPSLTKLTFSIYENINESHVPHHPQQYLRCFTGIMVICSYHRSPQISLLLITALKLQPLLSLLDLVVNILLYYHI